MNRTKTLLAATLLVLGLSTFSGPAIAGDAPPEGTMVLVNDTGHDVETIMFEAGNAPEGSDYWSDDLLEDGVIFEDGETIELDYTHDVSIDEESLYDLAMQWKSADDEDEMETKVWFKVDLDSGVPITLHYDEETNETSSSSEPIGH